MKPIFNRKHLFALAFCPLLLAACSEDFLDKVNPNSLTFTTFWVNEESVTRGLAAVYNPLRRNMGGYYGALTGIFQYQMRGDDTYPTRGEEAMQWETLSFINTPNTENACWEYLYTGIQLANEFLYNAPKVKMDQAKLNQMLGEAYFLRGFWYFRVRTDYGEGIVRTLPQEADSESHVLSSADEVLAQAISDLKKAKELLPKERPASENGRVTQGAAIAMLGKALLWDKDYAAARAEFETVMEGFGYDLADRYEDNFRDDTEFNRESIFEINYANVGDYTYFWSNNLGDNAFQGNAFGQIFGPSLKGSGVTGANQGGGWYKIQPSPYLVKQFIAEPRPAGSDSKWDKRLYTTCYFKYSDYKDVKADETFYDGFTFDDIFRATALPDGDDKWRITTGYAPAYPTIEGKEGRFLFKKFTTWWSKTGCTNFSNPSASVANYRVMRFAEVLFLHAEACLETGANADAMKDINRIRVRAGLPEKQLAGKEAITGELRNQKLLEFAAENIRWDDLVRWYSYEELKALLQEHKRDARVYDIGKDAEGKVTYAPTDQVVDTQNYGKFQAKHRYFPIPQAEVDANLTLEQKVDWQ